MLKTIFNFYKDGFKNLKKDSKKLWLLVAIKSAIILIVLFIFFPNYLGQFETKQDKSNVVSNSLLNTK